MYAELKSFVKLDENDGWCDPAWLIAGNINADFSVIIADMDTWQVMSVQGNAVTRSPSFGTPIEALNWFSANR
jgi:hypothetical protein